MTAWAFSVPPQKPDHQVKIYDGRRSSTRRRDDLGEWQWFLQSEFGVAEIDAADYSHRSRQGQGALTSECLLAFHNHGAEGLRDAKACHRFAYFCSLAEVFSELNDANGGCWPEGGRELRHAFHVRSKDGAIDLARLQKSSRLNIDVTDGFFGFLAQNDFGWYADRVFYADDKVMARLKLALSAFSKGYAGGDNVSRLVFFVMAMEALFTVGERVPIKDRLSRFLAALCYSPKEQPEAAQRMAVIYNKRSKAVHGVAFNISTQEVEQAQEFAALAIFHAFKLYKDLVATTKPAEIERRYFQYLECLAAVEQA